MTSIIVKFGAPEDVTNAQFDGRTIRFPCVFIVVRRGQTRQQKSHAKNGQITVDIPPHLQAEMIDGIWIVFIAPDVL